VTRASLSFRDGLGHAHRVGSTGPGVLVLPTRVAPLAAGLSGVLLLDEIKTLIERHNQQSGEHLVLSEIPRGGWCADCQGYVEAGQRCGCHK